MIVVQTGLNDNLSFTESCAKVVQILYKSIPVLDDAFWQVGSYDRVVKRDVLAKVFDQIVKLWNIGSRHFDFPLAYIFILFYTREASVVNWFFMSRPYGLTYLGCKSQEGAFSGLYWAV